MSMMIKAGDIYKHRNGNKFEVVNVDSKTIVLKRRNSKAKYKIGLDYFTSNIQTEGGKNIGERFEKTTN